MTKTLKPLSKTDARQLYTKTRTYREEHAQQHGATLFSANMVHCVTTQPLYEATADPWYLTLTVGTLLLQFYTRSWYYSLIAFAIIVAIENLAFGLLHVAGRYTAHYWGTVETRSNSAILDVFVFVLILFSAIYAFELSVLERLAAPSPLNAPTAFLVFAPIILTAFSRIYYLALLVQLASVWILAAITREFLVALIASAVVIVTFGWFLRPINQSYIFNAIFASLYITLFTSFITGVAETVIVLT